MQPLGFYKNEKRQNTFKSVVTPPILNSASTCPGVNGCWAISYSVHFLVWASHHTKWDLAFKRQSKYIHMTDSKMQAKYFIHTANVLTPEEISERLESSNTAPPQEIFKVKVVYVQFCKGPVPWELITHIRHKSVVLLSWQSERSLGWDFHLPALPSTTFP